MGSRWQLVNFIVERTLMTSVVDTGEKDEKL